MRILRWLFLLTAVLLVGCRDRSGISAEEQAFMDTSDYGLYSGGAPLMALSEQRDDYQMATDESGSYLRLQTDEQDKYVHMARLSGPDRPEVGAIVVVEITARGIANLTNGRYDMTVKKLKGDFVWLWNEEKQLGVVIVP